MHLFIRQDLKGIWIKFKVDLEGITIKNIHKKYCRVKIKKHNQNIE